ncbi:S8 family peptidase [Anatilimnocola sp. NA78]|uniref:S8 family peptidase n=1 Tax=Anatilimnocola sp. NA78 TaxID=3415683 RepID=UPI003CE57BC1
MDQRSHLFPHETGTVESYTYPKQVSSSEFRTPPRDRVPHSKSLISQIQSAEQKAQIQLAANPTAEKPKGIVLDFQSDPTFKLQLKSLERDRSGIELRNSRVDSLGVMHATVFIPEGKVGLFVGKFEAFANEDKDTPAGKPKNNDLVSSIGQIQLAVLDSFWTDTGEFPSRHDQSIWWEFWLNTLPGPRDVVDVFRSRAQAAGVLVSQRALRFPDRRVVLARATISQLLAIENLFDLLAELRLAKILTSEFVELPPRDQADVVQDSLSRIQPPPANAPSICHLDTGINRGHPLLALALAEEHLLSVDPAWPGNDGHPQQHGTGMAGLALYGCLSDLFNSTIPISLQHRLESVRILPSLGKHDPDLYGEVTTQAVYRIEIAAPETIQRAFALTVTADCRDEGYPSSWSAAIDQVSSGADEESRRSRLLIVSAGNTSAAGRHRYPDHNHTQGIEDPAQAWNALAVGAYTEKATIRTEAYSDWKPVANAGQISPASRTSVVWQDRTWPIKPDIVMEGGNQAIDPTTGEADYVDDLMLLTTRTSPTGALLTATGDTSAATALAARYAAIIWSKYPALTPESVRGMLVHSARWTDPMLAEFPDNKRHNRLRVYGYGVPDLNIALWSAGNNATLIIQDSLQPYDQTTDVKGRKKIKTKDMQLHRLPWPKDVLEQLGGESIRLRVTLSYFVEPSPGRRGWTRKHRYQSHGLRFEIMRPTETETEFLKRITRSAWDEDEGVVSSGTDDRAWTIGSNLRCKGSVHSDVWTGTAAQLAASGTLAVYPVTGWWKERPTLQRWNQVAKYSLILSLETDATQADLYTPIANQIGIPVPVATPT